VHKVLVLCTGNSARSILAEVLLNELGEGRFAAFSAGSHPAGKVNPGALQVLQENGHSVDGLSSKSWDLFTATDAPEIDIVITVCDNAAGETCPLWPGSPITVHWGIADPAGIGNEEESRKAFEVAYQRLQRRVVAMLELSLQGLGPAQVQAQLERIHDECL
jgi:arsenate reductase